MSKQKNGNGTMNPYVLRPNEVAPNEPAGYKIIAVAYEWGNWWCAFRGLTDWDDKQVEQEGDPIAEDIARNLFPAYADSGRYYGGN